MNNNETNPLREERALAEKILSRGMKWFQYKDLLEDAAKDIKKYLQSQSLPEPAKSLQPTWHDVYNIINENIVPRVHATNNHEANVELVGIEDAVEQIIRLYASQQSLQPEGKGLEGWIEIDIESENYPADFEPVYVFTADNKLKIGMLMKYGSDLENAEWQIDGLPYNVAFDYVTHYQDLPSPPQSK